MDGDTVIRGGDRPTYRFPRIRDAFEALMDVEVRGSYLLMLIDGAQRKRDAVDCEVRDFQYVRPPRPDDRATMRELLQSKREQFPRHLAALARAYDQCHEAEREFRQAIESARTAVDEAAEELDRGIESPLKLPTTKIKRVLDELESTLMSPVDGRDDPTEGAQERARKLKAALAKCLEWEQRLRQPADQRAGTDADCGEARAQRLGGIAAELRRLSKRFERIATSTAKSDHAVANIAGYATTAGRLIWDAAGAGAFSSDPWWVKGTPDFAIGLPVCDGGRRGELADDARYARLWSIAIGSWIVPRWPERMRRGAGDLDWVHRRMTDRGIEVVEAGFDEADLKDRHEQRAWVYADACRVVADEIDAVAAGMGAGLVTRVADLLGAWQQVIERTHALLGANSNDESREYLRAVRERQRRDLDAAARFACEQLGDDGRGKLLGLVADGVRGMRTMEIAVFDNDKDCLQETAAAVASALGRIRSLAADTPQRHEPQRPLGDSTDRALPKRPIPVCEAARVLPKRRDLVLNKLRRDGARIDEAAKPKTVELDDLLRSYPSKRKRIRQWADKEYPSDV